MADSADSGVCRFWAGKVGGFDQDFTFWNGFGVNAPFPDMRPRLAPRGAIEFGGAKLPTHDVAGVAQPTPLFLTANGANGSLRVNFGASQFQGKVPTGYFPGWPNALRTGYDEFDLSTAQGGVTINPVSGNVELHDSEGYIQSATGWAYGNYYFEYEITGTTVFSVRMGAGTARFQPGLAEWTNGAFSASDPNGGAGVKGPRIKWNNNGSGDFLPETVGTVVGVAVQIIPPPQAFIPQSIFPVSMRCVPCAPLFPGHRQWRAFG